MSKLKDIRTEPKNSVSSISMCTAKEGVSKIPDGATILDKKVEISVEEIENGFITNKRYEIKYQAKDKEYTDWTYYTVKMYSEKNPLELTPEATKNTPALADLFK